MKFAFGLAVRVANIVAPFYSSAAQHAGLSHQFQLKKTNILDFWAKFKDNKKSLTPWQLLE
jgi:hypothetical protein